MNIIRKVNIRLASYRIRERENVKSSYYLHDAAATASTTSTMMMLRTTDIDKELTATRLWFARIGHGQGPRQVANALLRLSNLIGNAAVGIAPTRLSITSCKGFIGGRTARAGASRVGILGIRATKLIHKEMND